MTIFPTIAFPGLYPLLEAGPIVLSPTIDGTDRRVLRNQEDASLLLDKSQFLGLHGQVGGFVSLHLYQQMSELPFFTFIILIEPFGTIFLFIILIFIIETFGTVVLFITFIFSILLTIREFFPHPMSQLMLTISSIAWTAWSFSVPLPSPSSNISSHSQFLLSVLAISSENSSSL